MGTGVVAFNLAPSHVLLCDTNPHLINFYKSISNGNITHEIVRDFLNREGAKLLEVGESHYYEIRERFNDVIRKTSIIWPIVRWVGIRWSCTKWELDYYLIKPDWNKTGQAVRQESWQEIESESLLLGKAVTTRRVPES